MVIFDTKGTEIEVKMTIDWLKKRGYS